MSASRLKWFIALWGALWTWLLASWKGISLATSLLRATTVFVMLAAVMIVFEVILDASRGAQKPVEDRPASEQPPAEEEPQEEREAA
jgi:hypothetical protein